MSAARHNLNIDQGETHEVFLTWNGPDGNPYNLTGFDARLQIRDGADWSLVVDVTGGGIVLGGAAGTVLATIPASATEDLPIGKVLVYDLCVIYPSGAPKYLAAGSVHVRPRVTVPA